MGDQLSDGPDRRPFQIPLLDGIRAVAFIMVFLSHAGLGNYVPGGFAVTIFFFLSGYLITSLLRREFEQTARIHLGNFFLRRCLRTLPPMYLTLALGVGIWAMGWMIGNVTIPDVLSRVFFMTNYYDRFIGTVNPRLGTDVYWSLAVEEHFYLTFPFVFMFLAPRTSFKQFALILGGLCALVLAWRCVIVFDWRDLENGRCYYCTDTRIDSIAMGCILALFSNPYMDPVWLRGAAGKIGSLLLGAVLLASTFIIRNREFQETFRYTIQCIGLFPVFYVAITNPSWPIFAWLDWTPVRFLGALSYTMYLSHILFLIHYHHVWPHDFLLVGTGAFLMSFGYACTMYYMVERPCAQWRKRLQRSAMKPASTP